MNATDPAPGSDQYTRSWYTFTTRAPPPNNPPVVGTPSPANGSTGNQQSLTWGIPINDPEGNTFSWTLQCNNGQTNSGSGAANGTKSLALSGLAYSTSYKVWVNATDPTPGSGQFTRRWYNRVSPGVFRSMILRETRSHGPFNVVTGRPIVELMHPMEQNHSHSRVSSISRHIQSG